MVTGIGATAQQVAGTPATTQIPPAEPVKRSSDNRRSNKPIMEKRRRARINNCLNELKTLILDAMKKDPARHSKLEKADILEMTVKHLENLQRQQTAMSQATDPSVMNKFKAGFNECAQEVGRFPELEPHVKRRLLQHLNNCINGVNKSDLPKRHHHQQQHQQQHILPSPPSSPEQHGHPHPYGLAGHPGALSAVQAGNGGVYMAGSNVQLIPTKLPNGSIAFMLPTGANPHQTLTTQVHPSQPPVPMLVPIPSRTASTGSASSGHSGSSSLYDRVPREHATSSPYHAPPSPANSHYEPMECHSAVNSSSNSSTGYLHQHQQSSSASSSSSMSSSSSSSFSSPDSPLSLVMKKPYHDEDEDHEMKHDDDGKPWRPW